MFDTITYLWKFFAILDAWFTYFDWPVWTDLTQLMLYSISISLLKEVPEIISVQLYQHSAYALVQHITLAWNRWCSTISYPISLC